jgi:cytochrome c biogenesis protein CcmG, thiol:disulfide interchange protein DsbE
MQQVFRRILSITMLALGLGWIVLSRSEPDSATGRLISAPQIGFFAPDFTLETLEGEAISLAEIRGQPVIVNFWASWCPPCRAEMPAIQNLYNHYRGSITILAVNATNQDIQANIQAYVTEYNLSFPILLDTDGSVNRLYAVTSLPTTFFIGADGIIQDVVIGGPITEAGLRARTESLLEAMP